MRFVKGQSGNPNGRPKGSKTKFSIEDLKLAIVNVEKEKKVSLLEHLVRRAYESDQILIALTKKIIPDAHDAEADESWLDSEIELIPELSKKEKVELVSKYCS